MGDLADHCLYISLLSDVKHCLSPVTFVFQAVSTAVPGSLGKGCALEQYPNLWVLSAGAQVSHVFSPTSFAFGTHSQYWLMLAEAGRSYQILLPPKVYCSTVPPTPFFFSFQSLADARATAYLLVIYEVFATC